MTKRGDKAISKSHFCILKVNNLRYGYHNILKFENRDPLGNV
jgi:hypothetical protein